MTPNVNITNSNHCNWTELYTMLVGINRGGGGGGWKII